MPRAYSGDLRRRVVAAALEGGQSREVVARRFAVGRLRAYRWVETAQTEGRLEARPMRGGPRPMIRDETEAALKDMVKSDNHLTLAEYRDRLGTGPRYGCIPGRWGGPSGVWGSREKKKTLRAIEQDEAAILEERQAWPETIAGIAVERFVFLDESAARTDLVRSHGWSPCGERAPGTAPCGHWERVTILGALGRRGSSPP